MALMALLTLPWRAFRYRRAQGLLQKRVAETLSAIRSATPASTASTSASTSGGVGGRTIFPGNAVFGGVVLRVGAGAVVGGGSVDERGRDRETNPNCDGDDEAASTALEGKVKRGRGTKTKKIFLGGKKNQHPSSPLSAARRASPPLALSKWQGSSISSLLSSLSSCFNQGGVSRFWNY
jgi:hypothetical protein